MSIPFGTSPNASIYAALWAFIVFPLKYLAPYPPGVFCPFQFMHLFIPLARSFVGFGGSMSAFAAHHRAVLQGVGVG